MDDPFRVLELPSSTAFADNVPFSNQVHTFWDGYGIHDNLSVANQHEELPDPDPAMMDSPHVNPNRRLPDSCGSDPPTPAYSWCPSAMLPSFSGPAFNARVAPTDSVVGEYRNYTPQIHASSSFQQSLTPPDLPQHGVVLTPTTLGANTGFNFQQQFQSCIKQKPSLPLNSSAPGFESFIHSSKPWDPSYDQIFDAPDTNRVIQAWNDNQSSPIYSSLNVARRQIFRDYDYGLVDGPYPDMLSRHLSEPSSLIGSSRQRSSSIAGSSADGVFQNMRKHWMQARNVNGRMFPPRLTAAHGPATTKSENTHASGHKALNSPALPACASYPCERQSRIRSSPYTPCRTCLPNRSNMGQEASQISGPDPDARQETVARHSQEDVASSNGWTAVNGSGNSDHRSPSDSPQSNSQSPSPSQSQSNSLKRKRGPKAEGGDGSPGNSAYSSAERAAAALADMRQQPHVHSWNGIQQAEPNATATKGALPEVAAHNGPDIVSSRKVIAASNSLADAVLASPKELTLAQKGISKSKSNGANGRDGDGNHDGYVGANGKGRRSSKTDDNTGHAHSNGNGDSKSKSESKHKNMLEEQKGNHSESESDVDTDALGLLQRVAAAESDEDDEPVVRPAPVKLRAIQPPPTGPPPYGWRPPQPPVGTHYTIYSPHAQPHGYVQPRPAPENFDPNAPLSAHEEAQLRDEGRFTKMEQSFLKDAIDEYCKKHTISVELANDYVCGKAREGNIPGDFWDEVCRALPQRTKNSIQRAAKRVFRNNQKKGPWTEEEEKALAEAYHKAPDQWAKICEEVPGRSAEQCRDRWRNYTQNGIKLTRGPWTDAEEAQFVEICKQMLAQARLERENQRRQGRTVSENFEPIDHLNFTAISAFMKGSRSRLHCRNKWHKLKKRPDVEAAIEAVMKGESNPTTTAITASQGMGVPSPQVSASTSYGQSMISPSSQMSTGTHPTGISYPKMAPATASGSPSNPPNSIATTGQPPLVSTNTSYLPPTHPASPGYHTFRPSPAPAFNQNQGMPPKTASLLLSRPMTAGPPLQAYTPSRPPLSSPLSAPSAQSPTSKPTQQVSSASIPQIPPPRAVPAQSSSPPSWVNTPPRVPQLFTPSPNVSASHHRATPGPKRVLPTGFQNAIVSTSRPADGSLSISSTPAVIGSSTPSLATASPSQSMASKSASPPAPLQQHSPHSQTPVAAESLVSLASLPNTAFSLGPSASMLQRAASTAGTQQMNGHSPAASMASSPDSTTSPTTSESRPVRKKQKTAKARGDN